MAIERRDRVKDSTTTTGTGTVTLSGTAPDGFRAFTDAHTTGATVRYAISLGAEWEVGEGVFTTSGNTLTRATVLASSNSGSLVNFSAGTKTVISTLTASEVSAFTPYAPPGGRLTLSSATPVMTSDVSNSTSIYYTPYEHDKVPLYDGTNWTMTTFTELTNTTTDNTKNPAAVGADSNYDLFVWSDSGTIRLGRGPAWSSATARGTGAGTTELERVNGIWVNKIAITNGPGAQRGTYVGTVRSDSGSAIDWELGGNASGGDPIFLNVWNAYNRVSIGGQSSDTTDSWSYTTTTVRPSNNSTTHRASFVIGLPAEYLYASFVGFFTTTGGAGRAGIGYDSTSAFYDGQKGLASSAYAAAAAASMLPPTIGFHYAQALERGNTGCTFYGDAGETFTSNSLIIQGHF